MIEVSKTLVDAFLVKLDTHQQLRDWCLTYLNVDFPMGHIDPSSNSSPIEWMFEAYTNYRHNRGNEIPGYIVLSSRESYKTWTESAFAILMMCHFGCTIAHMAAIEPQSRKAIEYISSFLTKVKPFLEAVGRRIDAQNKRNVNVTDKDGGKASVTVIIATVQGANSEHTNIMSIDEVDVMRFPTAYEEAKLIPGVFAGQFPLTIKTSTRKFAFGLMEKEIQLAPTSGDKLLRWNLLDVTERCPDKRHKPELPRQIRYIANELPLQNLSVEQYDALPDEHKDKYTQLEGHAGCATCPIFQVCKGRLASRPKEDVGGLYKPIDFTILQFKKLSPDMASAQLLCDKPSLAGLIYDRFDETEVTGNTLSISQAWESFTGEPAPATLENAPDNGLSKLVAVMIDKGQKFRASVDWGTRHFFVISVHALMPSQEWWWVDTFAMTGLDPEEMANYGERYNSDYDHLKFYPDNAYPGNIKMFRKRGMSCIDFKKDIDDGIRKVKSYIVDGLGRRRLKVLKHRANEQAVKMFQNHHYKLDPAGNPTREPDDEEYADIGDTGRYMGQNMPEIKANFVPQDHKTTAMHRPADPKPDPNAGWMTNEIRKLAKDGGGKGTNKSKSILWDFAGNEDE